MNSYNKSVFYIGTYSEYLYVMEFDSAAESLSVINQISHLNHPAYLCLSKDRKFLYTANENSDVLGGISAYGISDNYNLKHIKTINFTTAGPCHISLTDDQRYLLSAGYFDGRITVNPVNSDGSLAESSYIVQHNSSDTFRSGKIESIQSQARAHFICQLPGTKYLLATDLGSDKVYVYTLSNGKLLEHSTTDIAPGAGPRHLEIHPSGKTVYLICELNNTMYVLDFDTEAGILTPIQQISTLPASFHGQSYCSAVHMSGDGRFLYGSNRGHDSIVVFSVNEANHRITPIEYFNTCVKTPRDFKMDPTGKYMFIGNMDSNSITLCHISKETGIPEYISSMSGIEIPACIMFY